MVGPLAQQVTGDQQRPITDHLTILLSIRPPDHALVLALVHVHWHVHVHVHPFHPLVPAAAFSLHAAAVSVMVAVPAGRKRGVNQDFRPCAIALPHADNLLESVR